VNGVLFIISIGSFLWILIESTVYRNNLLVGLQEPLSSNKCPPLINQDCRWAQWVPGAYLQTGWLQFSLTHNLRGYSNALRVCPIWDGGVQDHSFLFSKSEAKQAAVAHHHFVAREYCVFLFVSFQIMREHAMLKDRFISRVACVLVFNNLMVVVSFMRRIPVTSMN